jgi:hypothetical protein
MINTAVDFDALIKPHYPNAKPSAAIISELLDKIKNEHKIDVKKMLYATSVCSDDINISTDFSEFFPRPFTMGGLGGLPFTGVTGMVAYSHHIPDYGAALIFYGPHIGISELGELGKMLRPGQQEESSSCGALMLALNRIQNEKDHAYVPYSNDLDYQQTALERSIIPFKKQILDAENPKKEITEVTYKNIDSLIHTYVKMTREEFKCKTIILVGGVTINTSPNVDDFVDIRNFEVIKCDKLKDKNEVV